MVRNYFGQQIHEISAILQNNRIREYILDALEYVLGHNGLDIKSEGLVDRVLQLAEDYTSLQDYEKDAHRLFNSDNVEQTKQKLIKRARRIVSQIEPYIAGNSVLDLGCGDGRVGELLHKSRGLRLEDITLADIYENPHVAKLISKGYNFVLFNQTHNVPIDGNKRQYDNILLLTVLHHSNNPLQTLQNAIRLTKKDGRIIIIESVYGVAKDAVEADTKDDEAKKLVEDFKKLSPEEQRLANIFFDHFYNRIIHYSEEPKNKVNVPYNFNTPEEWKKIFEKSGLRQIEMRYLGIDQPTVPEYHTLHVLEK